MFREYPYHNLEDLNLDYVLKMIRTLIEDDETLKEWRTEHEAEYEQLKALYDAVMSGNFPPTIVAAFKSWMQLNAQDLVGAIIKNVFFGLSDAGYFVAYIPESWDDIVFYTLGWDLDLGYGYMNNGRLVLYY